MPKQDTKANVKHIKKIEAQPTVKTASGAAGARPATEIRTGGGCIPVGT